MKEKLPHRLNFLLALAPALVASTLLIIYYYPFLTDDSMISLRYVERFLEGKGLTWTDGRPVEGYSNLLYCLIIALLGFLGMDLILAARVLGIACSLGVILVMGSFARRNANQSGLAPMLFLGLAAPMSIWALGGLEQPLLALLLAFAWTGGMRYFEASQPKGWLLPAVSLALGLACLTRPDSPVFCVAFAVALAWHSLPDLKKLVKEMAILASFPVLLYGGQILWRKSYYGEWVPNTALVKISPSSRHFWEGIEYVGSGLFVLLPFSLIALFLVFRLLKNPEFRSKAVLLLAPLLLMIPYQIFIGGDIFPGHRHTVPLIPAFALILTEGISLVGKEGWIKQKTPSKFMVNGLGIILFGLLILVQFADKGNRRAKAEKWEVVGRELAWNLRTAFEAKQPKIAITAAGCIPYHTKFPALDMLGLNDYWLPRHPPRDMGTGWIGHELGNADYVLQENPDLIVFDNGSVPSFRVGDSLLARPAFHSTYRIVKVRTSPTGYVSKVHFNLYSPKVGVTSEGEKLMVPPWLLGNLDNSAVHLNDRGEFVLEIRKGGPLTLDLDKYATRDSLGWEVKMEGESLAEVESRAFSDQKGLHIRLQTASEVKGQLARLELSKMAENSPGL
ncbi:MAG: hypothetical protein H6581_12920 [Bacteroidia bacterium]|nr:hypothetical protein [Bacteroidia bacterium]